MAFKGINDTLGHDAGDKLLQQVAHWLTDAVREEDSVARMGGDEFTVLLTEVSDADAAGRVAENVLQALTPKNSMKEHGSCRIKRYRNAMIPSDSDVPETVMKFADLAMYRAKELGKITTSFYLCSQYPCSQAYAFTRRTAYSIGFQPALPLLPTQVELATMNVVGLEVLLRWAHPDQGIIGPEIYEGR